MRATRAVVYIGLAVVGLLGGLLGGLLVIGPLLLVSAPTAQPSAGATDMANVTHAAAPTRTLRPTSTRASALTPLPSFTPTAAPSPTPEATATVEMTSTLPMPSPVPLQPSPTATATETGNPGSSAGSTSSPNPGPSPTATLPPAEITIMPISLTVSEPDGSASFRVGLTSEPVAPVLIPFVTSNGHCRVSPELALLDRNTWRTGVAVTVTAVEDAIADGLQTCEIRPAAASSAGTDYSGRIAGTVTVTVVDDDRAGIVVSPTSLAASEPDGSSTFSITLTSQPLSPVSIALALSNAECSVSPAAVVLDPGNWRTGVAVTVAAVDDATADGAQSCTVKTGAANSGDPGYNGLPSKDVTVTVADDDRAGIAVSPISLAVSEPDGYSTFSITLTSQPLSPVSIALALSNAECSVSPAAVVLDPGNWHTGVAVTVAAVDDATSDGAQSCTVKTGAANSGDPSYDGLPSEDVTVKVADDDRAGIAVSPTSLAVSEPDGSSTFSITLTSQPLSPVSIALALSNAECSVSPAAVVLDPGNWRSGVAVTVAAVDDATSDGAQSCTVETGAANSGDPSYNGLPSEGVTVTVADDDRAGIAVGPTRLAVSEPDGSSTFSITLTSQPTTTVVISMTGDAQTIVSPTQLVVTAGDWMNQRLVTVTVADDRIAQGTRTALIGLLVSSGDANYGAFVPESVAVTIEDDDAAGVVVTPTEVLLVEGGTPKSYQVKLTSQPTDAVTVTLSADASLVLTPTVLGFTGASWSVPHTVTVAAMDDGLVQSERTSTIGHTLRSADPAYGQLRVADVAARVRDGDAASTENARSGNSSLARGLAIPMTLPEIQLSSGLMMTVLVFGLATIAVGIEYLRTR
jgi:hypothetical protein